MEARSPGEPRGESSPPLTEVGETFTLALRLRDAEIMAGARQVHDLTPLHHDLAVARAAGYSGLIASGAHTGAIFMGMTASHFSTPAPNGLPRSILGLGFDLRFRSVVLADELITFRWTVMGMVWKASLNGCVLQADGAVHT